MMLICNAPAQLGCTRTTEARCAGLSTPHKCHFRWLYKPCRVSACRSRSCRKACCLTALKFVAGQTVCRANRTLPCCYLSLFLMLVVPYILVTYVLFKSNWMSNILFSRKLVSSTCFGCHMHPSSGAQL
jgi:hypothetical protein